MFLISHSRLDLCFKLMACAGCVVSLVEHFGFLFCMLCVIKVGLMDCISVFGL